MLGINRHSHRVHGSHVWRKINRIRVRTNTSQSGKHWSKCIIKVLETGTFRATQARGRHSITNRAIRMVSVLKLKWNEVVHRRSSIIDGKGFCLWRNHRPWWWLVKLRNRSRFRKSNNRITYTAKINTFPVQGSFCWSRLVTVNVW